MLLLLQSLAGEPNVEAAAAKPQEDGSGGRHPMCESRAFGHKATSGLFVEKALTTCSLLVGSLLAFVGSTLVEEALAVSALLLFLSSLLDEMVMVGRCLEAMALVLPHGVDCPLPIPVVAFRVGMSPM